MTLFGIVNNMKNSRLFFWDSAYQEYGFEQTSQQIYLSFYIPETYIPDLCIPETYISFRSAIPYIKKVKAHKREPHTVPRRFSHICVH